MSYWTLVILGALVTWRVTRFINKDDLINGTRRRVLGWLDQPRPGHPKRDFMADKLFSLITCPWCVSIYVSAGYLVLSRIFVVDSVPAPIWTWLAVGALSIIPYQFCDGDWIISISSKRPD